MTKDQLRMTNNELEARVIELETKLAAKEQEADVTALELTEALDAGVELQEKYDALEQSIIDEAASRPAIPYADWYYMLHPRGAGTNPDLSVLSRYDRIIA